MTTVRRGLGFASVYKIPNLAKQQTVASLFGTTACCLFI
jgi:hypothetical protein